MRFLFSSTVTSLKSQKDDKIKLKVEYYPQNIMIYENFFLGYFRFFTFVEIYFDVALLL